MIGGERSATGMWARADVRRRWRSLVLLGLLVGVTAGVALAALVGSFQNENAFQRLRRVTDSPDVTVFASQRSIIDPDWDALRAMPEVEQLGVWHLLFGQLDDQPFAVLFGVDDDVYLQTMNEPLVVEGRMFDPEAPNEVVVTEDGRELYPVGSTFDFSGMTQADTEAQGSQGFTGPKVTMTVVGVIRTSTQFVFTGQAFVSPGYLDTYDEIVTLQNADLELRNPVGDLAAVQAAAREKIGDGVPVFDLNLAARRVETTLGVESTALMMLAAVIAIVGGLLVAQAVGRSVASIEDDAQALQAMGMTSTDIARAATQVHALMIGVALLTMLAVAIAISGVFPVGLGRAIYPDPGIHVAFRWLLPGIVVAGLLMLVGVVLVAYRSTVRSTRRRSATVPSVVRTLRRLPWVSLGIGTTMAFDPGRGQRKIPVRAALTAATIGIAGVTGTLVVAAGIDETLASPERAGMVSDVDVYPSQSPPFDQPFDPEWVARVVDAAGDSAQVTQFGRFATQIDGVGMLSVATKPRADGSPPGFGLTVAAGRAPAAPGEVAIGPKSAEILDVRIGDTVTINEIGVQASIVGLALFPPEVHSGFDEGVWLSPTDFDLAASGAEAKDDNIEQWLGVSLPHEADVEQVAERINAVVAPDGSGEASVVPLPLEIDYLRNVKRLPLFLAAFLAVIAVLSLSHVLATTVRRRQHDFAVLRALGLERRPARMILNAQGTSIALFGLALGLPLGVIVGRRGWRWVTDAISLEYVPPAIVLAMLLCIPVAIVLVNALALWPGRRLARMELARHLRTE